MSDEFERGYQAGYRAALGAAAAECRNRATALDHGGHEYTRSQDLAKCAAAITGLRVPSIAIQSIDPAQWLRNNYDAYPNIASLCDAMREALATPPASGEAGAEGCGCGSPAEYETASGMACNKYARCATPPAVAPAGMVLVPAVPTEAMVEAGEAAVDRWLDAAVASGRPSDGSAPCEWSYRAMLAAAPRHRPLPGRSPTP